MKRLLTQLIRDDTSQDLAEYALLAAFVGLAGIAVWVAVRNALALRYVAMDTAEQNIWQPPTP